MKDNEKLLRIIKEQYKYALDYTDFLENTELMRLITAGFFAIILCEGGTHHSRFVAEKLVEKKVPAMYYKFGIRDLQYRANDTPREYKKILKLMEQFHSIISLLPKKDMEKYHENLTIGDLAIPNLTYIDYNYDNNLEKFYTAMIEKYQHS